MLISEERLDSPSPSRLRSWQPEGVTRHRVAMPKSAKVAPLIENEPVGVVNGDGPASGSSSPELTERERGNVPTYRVHGSTDETMTVGGNKPQEGWNDLVLQLLTERRRTIGQVHCTPPFLTHIETKGMANLSQLVYKTGAYPSALGPSAAVVKPKLLYLSA